MDQNTNNDASACATAAACGLGIVGATFAAAAGSVAVAAGWRNHQHRQEESVRMDRQMSELQADNRRTSLAADVANLQSQQANKQSAEAQQGIRKVASQTQIHGRIIPKIASQLNLDHETSRLLDEASTSSQG